LFSHSDNKSPSSPDLTVRRADAADSEVIGRLLHDFNVEFDEATPGPRAIADRVRELLARGDFIVLLASLVGWRCFAFAPPCGARAWSATWLSSTFSPSIDGAGSAGH
jgi:hypothetical protein